jgi:hypothetical protein
MRDEEEEEERERITGVQCRGCVRMAWVSERAREGEVPPAIATTGMVFGLVCNEAR